MPSNSYDNNADSFLYDCDEVPFDEIPPEPGREIKDTGFGALVIRVQKDDNEETDAYLSDNDEDSSKSRYVGPLIRTIHQSSERIVHEPDPVRGYYLDSHETSRKRRNVSSDDHRANYGRDVRRVRPLSANEGYHETDPSFDNPRKHHTAPPSYYDERDYDNRNMQAGSSQPTNFHSNRQPIQLDGRQHQNMPFDSKSYHRRDAYDPRTRTPSSPHNADARRNHKVGSHELVLVNERKYHHSPDKNVPNRAPSQSSSVHYKQPLLPNSQGKPFSVAKASSRPAMERLGPPKNVNNSILAKQSQAKPPVSRPSNKKPTNFIKRNIASSSVTKSKHAVPRQTTILKGGQQNSSAKQGPQIKKVTKHNPISKAKQKAAPKKTNLQKNIALLTQSSSKNLSAKTAILSPVAGPSNGTNAIADLINGILSEPDVKEMITSIAKQSVPISSEGEVSNQESSESNNLDSRDNDLDADVERTLDRANQLLNDNFKGIDATEFKTNRQIPSPKFKHVKISQYCKECRLEFPTTIMRDLHYKTEMHCFVNGDWWKFNPKPPQKIPKSKFPVSIFCILCWDIVRAQTYEALSSHVTSKRHKTNKQKFHEIFGRVPLYDWCMWDELSLNFRNSFVPVPSQLRNVMHPEYFYDQRVYKK